MLTLLWLLVAVIIAVCFDTIWDHVTIWRLLQRRIKPQGRTNPQPR